MFSIGDVMVIEVWHNVVTMLSDVTSVIGMGSIQTWSILHKLYTPYINQFVTNINQQIPEMSTPVRYVELSFDSLSTATVCAFIFPNLRTWDVNDSIKHLSPSSVSLTSDWSNLSRGPLLLADTRPLPVCAKCHVHTSSASTSASRGQTLQTVGVK